MIQRWICIAVMAAAAIGSPSESTDLVISTGKLHYAVGEEVIMTFTNVLETETVYVNGIPYWNLFEDESGGHVFPCVVLPAISPILAGDSETDSWTQVDCHENEQVAEGMYWVRVQYWTDSNPEPRISSVPFCIGEPCELPTKVPGELKTSTWGALKAQYKSR